MMDYRLVRSKRKTMSIEITPNAEVLVRAPLLLSQTKIELYLSEKQDWILSHLALVQEKAEKRAGFDVEKQLAFLLLGKEYPVSYGERSSFDGEQFVLPQEDIKQSIVLLYKEFAKRAITKRVAFYQEQMGVVPSSVKINSAKKRWGSCSGSNALNFSWLLIMAPIEALDYVVVHELAHIKQHNHSSAFWDVVATALPDYKKRQQQLKQLQHILQSQDWKS